MAVRTSVLALAALLALFAPSRQTQAPSQLCKATPWDPTWPSDEDWSALNGTLDGTLIKANPAASTCYNDSLLNSPLACDTVASQWNLSRFQATLPESVNYPLFANNSCLPPGADGYNAARGCIVGGSPQYIVNATTERQVVIAARWASKRNLRIVIKGTGHDLSGRSAGAYALSIWTHNFRRASFNPSWSLPGSNTTSQAVILGSGHNWGSASRFAATYGKVIVGGQDETVGLGGHPQGGGHGPLSSRFGLAADNILQARVITTEGDVLVVDDHQNQDLLWAIRGGGPGQYGIVTEYVMVAYDDPGNVVMIPVALDTANASVEAGWRAFAQLLAGIPDLMDAGVAGSGIASVAPEHNGSRAVAVSASFLAYNITVNQVARLFAPLQASVQNVTNGTVTLTVSGSTSMPDYLSFFNEANSSPSTAGGGSLVTSRLLGRAALSELPIPTLVSYLKRVLTTQQKTATGLGVFGLQGGPGPRNVPETRRGALNPAWRTAYVHLMSFGAFVDATIDPSSALKAGADWLAQIVESVWQEWAPGSGSYMNEGNPFLETFQRDFYGEPYSRLLDVKKKYDPTDSLFVLSGVGSDAWKYDLRSGTLCMT